MLECSLIIKNRLGLHARAAAKFVDLAKTFDSKVVLSKNDQSADGKEIMNILLLAAPKGTELYLSVKGIDERIAFEALSDLVSCGFGEE
tara:strand:+ start:228 stop:494 length:267 start_codon:yes stop_codon:yes gene_type:complete